MKHYISIAILSVFLTACGSGSGSSNSKSVAQVSGIKGLSYQIGNRTGMIKDDTKIDYKNGDEITFLLGKLELAKIKAKDNINLADFWPELPTTAKDFRVGLRKYYDVNIELTGSLPQRRNHAYGAQPTLHRASNIMQLLIAMDADGDATNGIDLVTGDWPTKLAELSESSLPLNTHLAEFRHDPQVKAFSQKYSLPLNMDIATPLKTLYQMANKTINVQPVTGYTTYNISPAKTVRYTFNDKMQIQSETEKNEGRIRVSKTRYEYDVAGNMTKRLFETDTDGDGQRNSHTLYEYSHNNYGFEQKSSFKRYNDSNADPATHNATTYTMKDNKALLQSKSIRNQINQNSDYSVSLNSYNDLGLMTEDKTIYYDANDQEKLQQMSKKITYHKNGTPAKLIEYKYGNAYLGKDETVYTYSGKLIKSAKREFDKDNAAKNFNGSLVTDTLDENHRLIKRRKDFKDHSNNTLRPITVTTYQYDEQGRFKSQTTEYFNDSGQSKYKKRKRREYSDKGLVAIIYESTPNYSLSAPFKEDRRKEFTYGDDGRMLKESSTKNAKYTYADAYATDGIAYLVHEMMLIDSAVR